MHLPSLKLARLIALTLVVVTLLAVTPELEACPTCKAGMEDGQHGGLQKGFYWSILFMMSMPFFIIGGLSSMFYVSVRNAKRHQSRTSPSESTLSE